MALDRILDFLGPLLERAAALWQEAVTIWRAGGNSMIGIALIALVMFSVGMSVQLKLRRTRFLSVPESRWRRWIGKPEEGTGPIGALIARARRHATLEDLATFFAHVRAQESKPFERDLIVMKVCVGTAPLVGLLGTVIGMLATFGALAAGSGGDKTMGLVAAGISEALITTQTGLVIALPGLFFQYRLGRKHERYKAFLAHLETVCMQTLYRELQERERRIARRAAAEEVARILYGRLRANTAAACDAPASPHEAERLFPVGAARR
jgi:biopolymer transport protein ExbB